MAVALSATTARRWWRPVPVLDVVLTLVLVGYAVAATARDAGAPHPATELAAATMTGSLLFRTRAPMVMAAVAAVGITGYALLPGSGSPLWTFLAILVICFSVGAGLSGRRRWAALGLLLASGYVLQLSSVDRQAPSDNTFSEVWVSPLVIIGGPALAGALLQRSRRQTAELERLSAALAEERERHAEAAATAERNRIARELHDVISHAVTVMVVQAGAAEQLLPRDAEARRRVHAIRQTGKEALGELRRQLGVLREGRPPGPGPLPGLADITDLVAAGGATLADCLPPEIEVPPGLGLTAYRTVQEALTNARRHAAGAPVAVTVSCVDGVLDLQVVDEGPGASSVQGSGNGLLGMRERVEMYGGRLDVGPVDGGGWRVHARLPLPAPDAGTGAPA